MHAMKILIICLLAVPLSFGAGIIAHSPTDNATIESGVEPFSFAASQEYRAAEITTCDVRVNGSIYKSLAVNDVLEGQSRRITQRLEPGTYSWIIECSSDIGPIFSDPRTVHVTKPIASDVEVSSSGVTRGSLIHEFTVVNDPIFVPKVAAGDFLDITVELTPSTYTREFYIKNRLVENGKNYLRLTSKVDTFYLYEGINETLPIGSAKVIALFSGMDGSRANFIIYPYHSTTPIDIEPEEEPSEDPQEDTPGEEPEEVEQEIPTPPVEEPTDTEPEEPPTERQGFFRWMLSLLARIFGT